MARQMAQAMQSDCKFPAGMMVPVIEPSRCEAKGPCVPACPYDVLQIRPLSAADKAEMSALARIKAMFHGNKRAFVLDGDACHGCGLCVSVCPEKAIKLKRR